MAKKGEAISVAWIGFFSSVIVAGITTYFTLRKGSDTSQTRGGINDSSFSTYGDNSPVVSGDMNIENQTVQHVYQEEKFVYVMQTQTVVKTEVVYLRNDDLGLTLNELTQISDTERRTGLDIPIPTNGIARIKAPQKMFDLSANLATAYNAKKIDECMALASEGTNLYETLLGAYNKDELAMISEDLLLMAAECYQVLSEYWMYKKDYGTGIQMSELSQNIHPDTNVLTFATQAAMYQLSGQDAKFSAMLGAVRSHFPEPIRYEIINTLTRMGYLRPDIAKKNQDGKWEIRGGKALEAEFNLTKDLQFPMNIRLVAGSQKTNPTIMRWVGLNQFEPVDLVQYTQRALDKLNETSATKESAP